MKKNLLKMGRIGVFFVTLGVIWPVQTAQSAVVRYCTASGAVVTVDSATMTEVVTYYDCTTRVAVYVYPARPAYVAHPVGVGPASVRGVARRTARRTTRRMHRRHR
jgi:hypothetical protein